MSGRVTIRAALLFSLGCAALFAGCEVNSPPPASPAVEASSAYDPATVGEVTGRVEWTGAVPVVPPFQAPVTPLAERLRGPKLDWPNPNAPVIDPKSHGIGNAVVFLSGVDPKRARPWNLDPVTVELRGYQIHVRQGNSDGPYGFVQRGDRVEMESKQDVQQTLQANGADYFALALPELGVKRSRILNHNGLVELSTNNGQFWMRAYLFVDDHPYYARTNGEGRYTLPQAPPGDYDLVCRMPDWRPAGDELDADTRLVDRLTFRGPQRIVKRIHIESGATTTADFTLSLKE